MTKRRLEQRPNGSSGGQDAPESRPCSRITTMDAGPVAITPRGCHPDEMTGPVAEVGNDAVSNIACAKKVAEER